MKPKFLALLKTSRGRAALAAASPPPARRRRAICRSGNGSALMARRSSGGGRAAGGGVGRAVGRPVDQHFANINQVWSSCAQPWPILSAKMWPKSGNLVRIWPESGPNLGDRSNCSTTSSLLSGYLLEPPEFTHIPWAKWRSLLGISPAIPISATLANMADINRRGKLAAFPKRDSSTMSRHLVDTCRSFNITGLSLREN